MPPGALRTEDPHLKFNGPRDNLLGGADQLRDRARLVFDHVLVDPPVHRLEVSGGGAAERLGGVAVLGDEVGQQLASVPDLVRRVLRARHNPRDPHPATLTAYVYQCEATEPCG